MSASSLVLSSLLSLPSTVHLPATVLSVQHPIDTDETGTQEHSNANSYNHYYHCHYYYCCCCCLLVRFFPKIGDETEKSESDIHLLFSGKANNKNSCPGLYNLVMYCVFEWQTSDMGMTSHWQRASLVVRGPARLHEPQVMSVAWYGRVCTWIIWLFTCCQQTKPKTTMTFHMYLVL